MENAEDTVITVFTVSIHLMGNIMLLKLRIVTTTTTIPQHLTIFLSYLNMYKCIHTIKLL